ncbi:MAG TPA: hypothetical protein VGA21_12640 [Cyclobacteriaceae bacterium]|jgi:hypothetical protein
MSIALNTIRTGKKYFFRNFGEEIIFQVTRILSDHDFKLKDLNSLETYTFSDLIQFGKGQDYELIELERM